MVTILIISVLRVAVVITGEALISMWIPKGTALIRGNTEISKHFSKYFKSQNISIICYIFLEWINKDVVAAFYFTVYITINFAAYINLNLF